MRNVTCLVSLLMLVGCGHPERYGCNIQGKTLVCLDGTQHPLPVDGSDGQDGRSPLVTMLPASLAQCPTGGQILIMENSGAPVQTAVICNGADAPPAPLNLTEIIDPCGDALGIYDEVMLRLADNTIIASFSDHANGNNTRFSIIVPGSYMTTDGSNCHFTVGANGEIL